MYKFKERLQYLIDIKNITQAEVAAGIKVNEARVSDWITERVSTPRRKTITKLAYFFNCDIEWLATGKGEPFPKEEGSNTSTTIGKFKQKANSIHQSTRDMQIHNIHGDSYQLSAMEQSIIEIVRKLPNKEEFLRKVMRMALDEEEKKK